MAYVEHGMWEVLEVLKRLHSGLGIRSTARATGRDRRTVRRYAEAARELGWVAGLHEPSEELAQMVIAAVRPGPKGDEPSEVERDLAPHKSEVENWLKPKDGSARGLTLTKVHSLLERKGVEVTYSGLHRYAVKHLGFGERQLTVRVADVSPGEVAQVDFGRLGLVYDEALGRNRYVHVLLVTLVYSRHQYGYVTRSQKLKDLIVGLDEAWEFFGGVPRRVIIDNLKAAVVKADRYEPSFQRTFAKYAEHHGFVIDAAVSREPTHKPHVERQVPYVRENFFRGESFLNQENVQRDLRRWCVETAGMRTHGTTRRQPFVEFEAFEQGALLPLNPERFDTPNWGKPKVHPDCHVRFQNALYSVPYKYRGKEATVCGDSKLVRVYIDGQLVKTHDRKEPGQKSTDYSDYPESKSPYAMRDTDTIIAKARDRGTQIGAFTERLLSGDFPWAHLRQAQKLMRLCDKYGDKTLETACQRALSFDLINVKRLEGIVKNALDVRKCEVANGQDIEPRVIQMPLRFLRDNRCFAHSETSEGN